MFITAARGNVLTNSMFNFMGNPLSTECSNSMDVFFFFVFFFGNVHYCSEGQRRSGVYCSGPRVTLVLTTVRIRLEWPAQTYSETTTFGPINGGCLLIEVEMYGIGTFGTGRQVSIGPWFFAHAS
jgi:hypothetical protein